MTNDEIPMTKQMPAIRHQPPSASLRFVIGLDRSSLIRHSNFVIRIFVPDRVSSFEFSNRPRLDRRRQGLHGDHVLGFHADFHQIHTEFLLDHEDE